MSRMTGGQALARSLRMEGVEWIFGLPGVQLYYLLDALYDEPDIHFITTRHEQATTYMADGYARLTSRVGTALVVPGPGVYNAGAGLATAYAASSPVLLVAGQVDTGSLGKGRGVLHEVHDQLNIVRPVTKWCKRIFKVEEIPQAVHEAFRQLKSDRPRPVVIEIPPDTLSATGDVELIEPEEYAPVAPDPDKLEQAAQVLGHAKNPIIWAGGGVHISRAWEALQRVAEHLQAPVLTTPEGKGAISDRHYLSMGATTAYAGIGSELVPKADAILVVGSRFVAPATASWGLKPGQQVVQVDIDAEEVGRNFPAAVGVVGDARLALEGLYERMQRRIRPRPSRKAKLEALKKTYHEKLRQVEPQGSFVEAIRAALPEDCIYIAGMTQVGYYSHIFFPVYRPRTYITSSYMGTLGYEYPTALGAKVAHPDRPVVVTIGDGGFLYNAQELATAVKYNIPVVAVVFNDNAYGNSLRDQKLGFNGRVIGTELHNPNFVKFTESFGAVGLRARDDKELQFMLKEALADGRPTVIEVPVGPMPNPFRYRRL